MKHTLYILQGGSGEEAIDLVEGTHVIGRDADVAIQIDSRMVSRKHAQIVVKGNQVEVIDLGSANGTLLNQKAIVQKTLKAGDQIQIGEVTMEYRSGQTLPPSAGKDKIPTVGRTIAAIRTHKKGGRPTQSTYVRPSLLQGVHSGKNPLPLRLLTTALLSTTLLAFVLLGGFTGYNILKAQMKKAALQRASTLVQILAEKNREDLRVGNELLLDVESVQNEKGVKSAFIINQKGRTVAPVSRVNQLANDPFTTEALTQKSDRKIRPSPELSDGSHILVHPIRAYDDHTGQYETLGAAKIIFSPEEGMSDFSQLRRLFFLLIAAAIAIAFALGWLFSKAITAPLLRLGEKLQRWRLGQKVNPDGVPPFSEWGELYEAVERILEEKKP